MCHGHRHRHGVGQNAWMGHQTNESARGNPRQPDRRAAIEAGFPPCTGFKVKGGALVVSVNKQVDIWNDHDGHQVAVRLCAHLGRVSGGEFDGFQFIRQLIEFAGINAGKEFGGVGFEAVGFTRRAGWL